MFPSLSCRSGNVTFNVNDALVFEQRPLQQIVHAFFLLLTFLKNVNVCFAHKSANPHGEMRESCITLSKLQKDDNILEDWCAKWACPKRQTVHSWLWETHVSCVVCLSDVGLPPLSSSFPPFRVTAWRVIPAEAFTTVFCEWSSSWQNFPLCTR